MPENIINILSELGTVGALLLGLRYIETLRLSERQRADRYERFIMRIAMKKTAEENELDEILTASSEV